MAQIAVVYNLLTMILSDVDIKKALKSGEITVSPYDSKNLQQVSIDLHLDKHFLVYDDISHAVIDPKQPIDHLMREVSISKDKPFVLHPGAFALGAIYETTGVSASYLGRLEGKSSVGRLGILIHTVAGFLNPGNTMKMTLELHNTANLPILLYYKMPIAQMAFEKLSSPTSQAYGSHEKLKNFYQGDTKPRASQMWKNFEVK